MDVFLLSIVISTNKTEAAVQDTNEGTLNVQWEDENFGESICNALKKEEVTYADIEGITGISIDSQYVVKLDWKDKTEEYVYKRCKLRSNGMPVPLLRNGYSIFNGTKYR